MQNKTSIHDKIHSLKGSVAHKLSISQEYERTTNKLMQLCVLITDKTIWHKTSPAYPMAFSPLLADLGSVRLVIHSLTHKSDSTFLTFPSPLSVQLRFILFLCSYTSPVNHCKGPGKHLACCRPRTFYSASCNPVILGVNFTTLSPSIKSFPYNPLLIEPPLMNLPHSHLEERTIFKYWRMVAEGG